LKSRRAGRGQRGGYRDREGVDGTADRTAAWIGLAGALGAALLLQACREDEQDRPLIYDKGSYSGPADPPLDTGRVEQLRTRAQNQRY
jgi:hypothetical protein